MSTARIASIVLLLIGTLAGCGVPAVSPAGPSPVRPAPTLATTAATGAPSSEAGSHELDDVVAAMAAAVRAGDRAAYLALVDLSDPVFSLEHGRWANGWSGPNPVTQYDLEVANVRLDGDAATAQLGVTWALQTDLLPRMATFAARFSRAPDGWRYAGEDWVAADAPHFRVLVAPGLEHTTAAIIADLPGIYEHVTTTLGYVPQASMEIKEYADGEALVANTLLSLPVIRGWNEPGEALKLRLDPDAQSLAPVIAHEFSHFAGFDRAGTQRTRMPWWLDEGVASFVASAYEGTSGDERLATVQGWEASGELAFWDDMAVFERAPVELWQFVYPQGYAMVRYISEAYGAAARNAWLAAMATEMDIGEATPAILGVTFNGLDAGFRSWLRDGRS